MCIRGSFVLIIVAESLRSLLENIFLKSLNISLQTHTDNFCFLNLFFEIKEDVSVGSLRHYHRSNLNFEIFENVFFYFKKKIIKMKKIK